MSISEQSIAEIKVLQRRNSNGAAMSHGPKRSYDNLAPDVCRVCGDGNAKMHYGVITCFGCKGFFRRTLKRPNEYQCRHNGTCVVDRHERNSCRYCRFRKCIEVGMDPKAVRPDRDATGRHYQGRQRRSKLSADDEGEVDAEWMRKLPVDMRTTLMQLMNIELMVIGGDLHSESKSVYPLTTVQTLRQALEDPTLLDGKRTEMRYDCFREVDPSELPHVAHRRLLAIIDWVDHLFDMADLQGIEDKLLMVKNSFAPLMVFSFSAATAKNTKQSDIVCLSNHGFIRRNCCQIWPEPYHFNNRLAERAIDEIIEPLRRMNLKDEEVILMKAIIILNPHVKHLSTEASEVIADMRDRIQETLYHVVRETHPKEVASSRFGNLLLFVPSVMMLGSVVTENLTFIDSFGHMSDRLMHDFLLDEEPPMQRDDKPTTSAAGTPPSAASTPQQNSELDHADENGVATKRRYSEPRMTHSASSSSIESLHSCNGSTTSSSTSYSENGQPNQQQPIPYNYSSSSLPTAVNAFDVSLNSASSMPNLDNVPECDPDYNVTITPDMFSGMRQAMSVAHNMDTSDSQNGTMPANGMLNGMSNGAVPMNGGALQMNGAVQNGNANGSMPGSPIDRPTFFIESTKHKFTVTTSFDKFSNNYSQQQQQMMMQQQGQQMQQQNYPHMAQQPQQQQMPMPPQQQPLGKTNSLPPQYYSQYEQSSSQPMSNVHPLAQVSMGQHPMSHPQMSQQNHMAQSQSMGQTPAMGQPPPMMPQQMQNMQMNYGMQQPMEYEETYYQQR